MRITLVNYWGVINSTGGAEKALCEMANSFVARGHNVTIVCCEPLQGLPAYFLDSRVNFVNAYKKEFPWQLSRRLIKLRAFSLSRTHRHVKHFKLKTQLLSFYLREPVEQSRPDVIICYQFETTVAVSSFVAKNILVVNMFHRDPTLYEGIPEFSSVSHLLSQYTHTVQLETFIPIVQKLVPNANVIAFPNPVPQFTEAPDYSSKKIICVGRLLPSKRPDLLITAFNHIKEEFDEWEIEFWGDFNSNRHYTRQLEDIITSSGLQKHIKLCGITGNIVEKLKHCSIFAFPSESESFSLALTEAMSIGLPVVACQDCQSILEFIKTGYNGVLSDPTPIAYAQALRQIMKNQFLRRELGHNGKQDMMKFAPEKVWDDWEKFLLSEVQRNKLK